MASLPAMNKISMGKRSPSKGCVRVPTTSFPDLWQATDEGATKRTDGSSNCQAAQNELLAKLLTRIRHGKGARGGSRPPRPLFSTPMPAGRAGDFDDFGSSAPEVNEQDETVEGVVESGGKNADDEIGVREMFAILLQGQKALAQGQKALAQGQKSQGESIEHLAGELRLQGKKIDEHGKKIDEHGKKIDEHGKKIDKLTYDVGCIRGDANEIAARPRIASKYGPEFSGKHLATSLVGLASLVLPRDLSHDADRISSECFAVLTAAVQKTLHYIMRNDGPQLLFHRLCEKARACGDIDPDTDIDIRIMLPGDGSDVDISRTLNEERLAHRRAKLGRLYKQVVTRSGGAERNVELCDVLQFALLKTAHMQVCTLLGDEGDKGIGVMCFSMIAFDLPFSAIEFDCRGSIVVNTKTNNCELSVAEIKLSKSALGEAVKQCRIRLNVKEHMVRAVYDVDNQWTLTKRAHVFLPASKARERTQSPNPPDFELVVEGF
jgi:uncharacterized protein YoaH (UPF0181 family)